MKTTNHRRQPAGFTVIELMMVFVIIALLLAMSASAFNAAVAQSKISRTKVIIAKLDQLVMDRYETYRTRPVPIRATDTIASNNPQFARLAARNRLNALRDIMRMELPHARVDVTEPPIVAGLARPAVSRGYQRKTASVTWSDDWQSAECLYLIIASMRDGDKSALDFFSPEEIGDVDEDGVPEILDAWGQPIIFVRWAPGYSADSTEPAVSVQSRYTIDPVSREKTFNPDRFDLLKVDTRWNDMDQTNDPFDLKPLIFSMGPDKELAGIQVPDTSTSNLNDPYRQVGGNYLGTILNATPVADNVTNHYQEAE